MSSTDRQLAYADAINEALHQAMARDPSVLLIGQGVKSPWYVGRTCRELASRFGEARVIDTPVSENAVTGAAVGAAIAGMKAIVVHPRIDFMLYALDPIVNQAANWSYMYSGQLSVPVVVWGILNRGGEQGAQHSQALHATFAHIPGLKVVMPATPYDAKGLMAAAIADPNPVVFVDDRWQYGMTGTVPEEPYEVPIGRARIAREGHDVTVVASGFLVGEAVAVADELAAGGLHPEVVDLRTIKPLDTTTILASVRKTGRLLAVDCGWRSFGVAAEICALVAEGAFADLRAPVHRLALPDCPAPASRAQERAYFVDRAGIAAAIRATCG